MQPEILLWLFLAANICYDLIKLLTNAAAGSKKYPRGGAWGLDARPEGAVPLD